MVELSNDDIKCIAEFESITGAAVKDCLITDKAVAFIVAEGQLGKAIGKKGANITRVRQRFARQVLIFEDSSDMQQFIRNLFGQIPIKSINVHEKLDSSTVFVTVDEKDRGSAIGRNGDRIKLARALLQRRFGCDLRLVSR
ncbi:MAG: NusA-like transcription termination signal-binding factor [Candidatus Micrarchaeota archaeon]|nr:NusA-like transcription termination signal-binding factor [Candidatus Micrarchaeota archaeon]